MSEADVHGLMLGLCFPGAAASEVILLLLLLLLVLFLLLVFILLFLFDGCRYSSGNSCDRLLQCLSHNTIHDPEMLVDS